MGRTTNFPEPKREKLAVRKSLPDGFKFLTIRPIYVIIASYQQVSSAY